MDIFWISFGIFAVLRLFSVLEDKAIEWGTRPRYFSYLEVESLYYPKCGAEDCYDMHIGVCNHPGRELVTNISPVRWVKQVRWRR